MTILLGKRTNEPVTCGVCARTAQSHGYKNPPKEGVMFICDDCTSTAKAVSLMIEKELDHFEKIAVTAAAQSVIYATVCDVLAAVYENGIDQLSAMTQEKLDLICEHLAMSGQMIEHGRNFLIKYGSEMTAQVSRGDPPF